MQCFNEPAWYQFAAPLPSALFVIVCCCFHAGSATPRNCASSSRRTKVAYRQNWKPLLNPFGSSFEKRHLYGSCGVAMPVAIMCTRRALVSISCL
jgi:hypothetical protein